MLSENSLKQIKMLIKKTFLLPILIYPYGILTVSLMGFNIISNIVIIETMSWTSTLPSSTSIQSGSLATFFTSTSLPPEKLALRPETFEESGDKNEGIEINLTVEQLLAAGYEVNKKPWSEEEDKNLIDLFREGDLSWKEIAQRMPGRTSKMCYSRYRRIENRLKEQWTSREDVKIQSLVGLFGENWERISQFLPKRNPKQIQDHYMNYLRPEINKEPWTFEEDLLLIELLRTHGRNWSLIEKSMKGRTQSQIKNRYFGRLKRMQEKKDKKEEKENKDQANDS